MFVDRTARSSAKSRSSSWLEMVHRMPRCLSAVVLCIVQSMTSRGKNRWEVAALTYPRSYRERLRDCVTEYDTAFKMVIKPLYYWDYLIQNSMWLRDLPQGFAVDAVECLLEVNEIDKEGHIPLCALLYDISKSKNLVFAPSAPSESSLFFAKFVVDGIIYSV